MIDLICFVFVWLIAIMPFLWLAHKEVKEEEERREKFLAFLRRFRDGLEKQNRGK